MTDREQQRAAGPTAITGTWSDLERHARYIYANADEQSSEWMLAEAALVLLREERGYRRALVEHHNIANLSEEVVREGFGSPDGCPVCRKARSESA